MTYPQYPGAPAQGVTLADPLGGGGGGVHWRNVEGRTCAVIVHTYNPNAIGFEGKGTAPSVTYDMYILDGPAPLTYGETEKPPTPPTKRIDQIPAFVTGCISSHQTIAPNLAPYAGTSQPVVGRVVRGTQGNRPWMFVALGSPLDTRAGEAPALRQAMIDLIVRHRSQQWTPPAPADLSPAQQSNGAAYPQYPGGQPTPQVQYGPPPTQYPSLPQPSVAPIPSPPQGWTVDLWAQAYPAMDEATRSAWAQVPRA